MANVVRVPAHLGVLLILCTACSFLLTVFSASTPPQAPSPASGPLVLLVSFDGFRWDYLDRTATPTFDSLIKEGVKAKFLFDAFVSKTFPNHYTIATGLYQESHGLIGNNMYNPATKERFSLHNKLEPKWWNGGEPIWVTNQRQGGRSGVIMFPGMEVKIRGQYASFRLPKYNPTFPYEERVNIITSLFANGSINLGLLYFNEPDHSGHTFGPSSPEMNDIIQMCDTTLAYLMKKLSNAGLEDRVDVIITSDHGMADVSSENFMQLDDFVDPSLYRVTNNNPVLGIWPFSDSDVGVIYGKLRNASQHVSVYLKDDIPVQYHYHDNFLIAPILLVAEEGWQIRHGNNSGVHQGNHGYNNSRTYRGNHGYNNSLMSMHPIFVAHGPSFRQGLVVEPFENVNIYPLICKILGIEPSPNNGSLEKVQHLLTVSSEIVTMPPSTPAAGLPTSSVIGIAIAGVIGMVAVCLVLAMCVRQRSYSQPVREYTPIADTSLDAIDNQEDSGFVSYPNTKI